MEVELGLEQELGDGTGYVVWTGSGLLIRAGTGIKTGTGIPRTGKTNHGLGSRYGLGESQLDTQTQLIVT